MYGRKVKLRFFFIFLIAVTLSLTIFLILKSLEENVVYFKSPSEIKTLSEMQQKKIRIGGMVKTDSISIGNKELSFVITDFKSEIVEVLDRISLLILCSLAEAALSEFRFPNLTINLFFSLSY